MQVNAVVATQFGPSGIGAELELGLGAELPAPPVEDGEGSTDVAEAEVEGVTADEDVGEAEAADGSALWLSAWACTESPLTAPSVA